MIGRAPSAAAAVPRDVRRSSYRCPRRGAAAGATIGRVPKRIACRTLVALAVMASAAAWSSGAQTVTHTTATVYQAFSYHGVIVPHVRVESGYCWENSNVTARRDAWRCFVGNFIYDPCFSSTFAYGVVVCPTPWTDTGIEIRLTKPLPKAFSHAAPSLKLIPWALQTASGADCILSSGASNIVHGQRLNYSCGTNTGLWGFPRRASQPWTILSAPFNATVLSHRVAILHAWM